MKTKYTSYKACLQQAEKLLADNWQAVVKEARRLEANGLPIVVLDEDLVRLSYGGCKPYDIDICPSGIWITYFQVRSDGSIERDPSMPAHEGGVSDIVRFLEDILQDRTDCAQTMGEIADLLASA